MNQSQMETEIMIIVEVHNAFPSEGGCPGKGMLMLNKQNYHNINTFLGKKMQTSKYKQKLVAGGK